MRVPRGTIRDLTNYSDNLVSFDNLTIRRKNGVVRSVKEYYPFQLFLTAAQRRFRTANPDAIGDGLEYGRFNGSFSYNAVDMYNKGYTSATWHELEWKYEGLDLNYFAARYFDPIIGRWHAPDPLEQCHSPYAGMVNDPANFVDPDGRLGVAVVSMAWCGQTGAVVTVANTVSTVSQGLSVMGGIMNFVSTCAGIVAGVRGFMTTAEFVNSTFPGEGLIKQIGEFISNANEFVTKSFKRNIRGSFSEKRDFRRYTREVNRRLANSSDPVDLNSLNMQRQTIRSMRNGSIVYELRRTNTMPISRQVDRAPSNLRADPTKNKRNGRIIIEYSQGGSNVSLAGSVSAINLFQSRQMTFSDDERSVYDDGSIWDEVDAQQFVDARNSMRPDGINETADRYIKEMKGSQISLSTDICRTITTQGRNWGQQDCNSWESFIEEGITEYYIDEDGRWSSPEIRKNRRNQ